MSTSCIVRRRIVDITIEPRTTAHRSPTDRSRPLENRMKRLIPVVLVVGVAVLVLATSGGASKTKPATASTAKPVVAVRGMPLGKILVDAQGRTLYLFE